MKREMIGVFLAAVAGRASPPEPPRSLTVDDVLRMKAAGVAPDVIVAHIRGSQVVEALDTDRIISLSRDQKLEPRILEALVEAAAPACAREGAGP